MTLTRFHAPKRYSTRTATCAYGCAWGRTCVLVLPCDVLGLVSWWQVHGFESRGARWKPEFNYVDAWHTRFKLERPSSWTKSDMAAGQIECRRHRMSLIKWSRIAILYDWHVSLSRPSCVSPLVGWHVTCQSFLSPPSGRNLNFLISFLQLYIFLYFDFKLKSSQLRPNSNWFFFFNISFTSIHIDVWMSEVGTLRFHSVLWSTLGTTIFY